MVSNVFGISKNKYVSPSASLAIVSVKRLLPSASLVDGDNKSIVSIN